MENKSNYKKFLLLWSGEFISSIGGGLTSFGLSVYIFQKTGSAASMALVALLSFLPVLLLSPIAGVLADRYDRCLMMMLGDGMSGLGLVYILICMFTGKAGLYQICIGVFISAVFSSLLEPSYRAVVTDMLTKDEYSKASGMMSLAGSARYLISPMIAGFLLTVSDVKLLLIIDICTFILTVVCTAVVRNSRIVKQSKTAESFMESFKDGWKAITKKKGIFVVIMVSSVITCFMGAIEILVEPMILDFQTSKVLGFGFLFFFMLPFANNCLDYLARTNIDADKQGRAWGLISFLSQLGYVVAYAGAGLLADKIAEAWHVGVGRGAAVVIMVSGVLLAVMAILLSRFKSVRDLESGEKNE